MRDNKFLVNYIYKKYNRLKAVFEAQPTLLRSKENVIQCLCFK